MNLLKDNSFYSSNERIAFTLNFFFAGDLFAVSGRHRVLLASDDDCCSNPTVYVLLLLPKSCFKGLTRNA